jgi:hypothetical protein
MQAPNQEPHVIAPAARLRRIASRCPFDSLTDMVDVLREKSTIEGEERSTERVRTQPIRLGLAACIALFVLATPALYRPSQAGKLPFDNHYISEMNAVRPDYVLIGNSMLGTRIDPAVLARRLGENCCYVMWTAGAESAWEHQALKNHILAATHRPKKVFVFFRDTFLTRPSYRAQDIYWWRIERLSHDEEPELERAMRASRTWQETLEYYLGRLYPVQKRRVIANALIERAASSMAGTDRQSGLASPGARYNDLFALDRMRLTESDDTAFDRNDPAYFDFKARVADSLLPSMISLAQRAGVQLVFVRVQRRPTAQGPAAPTRQLQDYLAALREYLARNGAGFHDFTGDPQLTLDHYLDGDHIRPEWKQASTQNFLERMREFLP